MSIILTVLWHLIDARCDVTTLPQLLPELRAKGRFTEKVAKIVCVCGGGGGG